MTTSASPADTDGTRAWRSADLGGLELFQAALSEFAFSPHAHEEFFIAITDKGLAASVYRGDSHAIGPGDMIVLNPEEAHAGGPAAGGFWTYRALYAPVDLMRQVTAELRAAPRGAGLPRFAADVIRDPQVATLLRRYHWLSLSPAPEMTALERQTCLTVGLAVLTARHASPPRPPRAPGHEPRAVGIARDFLASRAEDNVTLRDLTERTGLSPYYLCRVFRQATGMSPHAYQLQIRVRRGKCLLLAGRPIAEAATRAGFYDQAHFSRHFKRMVGLSPGRYLADLTA